MVKFSLCRHNCRIFLYFLNTVLLITWIKKKSLHCLHNPKIEMLIRIIYWWFIPVPLVFLIFFIICLFCWLFCGVFLCSERVTAVLCCTRPQWATHPWAKKRQGAVELGACSCCNNRPNCTFSFVGLKLVAEHSYNAQTASKKKK